ncbi:MAG TPA: hypothetical protein VIJ82_25080 [Streptosporangiaceae bacterium]|jgi:hypothetical protein
MAERDVDPAGSSGRPLTTGEFRVAPDASASTSQFQAFASRQAADSEAPWQMKAPGRSVGRLAGIVVLVAIVLGVIALLVLKA